MRGQTKRRPRKTWEEVVRKNVHDYRQVPRSGNLPVLFLLSSQRSTFCPQRKNYELGRKMVGTFSDGHDELYRHAKVGGDRTTRAGCRCKKYGVCHCFSSVTLRHINDMFVRGDIVRTGIALLFIGRFQRGFQRFFRRDCSFSYTT